MPPPIVADLRPYADRSAVRTASVACRAAMLPIAYAAAGCVPKPAGTDSRIAVLLNAPLQRAAQ